MDWSKAKNVLILIFLVLDIFLAFNLKSLYFGDIVPRETISDAVAILRGMNVTLECRIPQKTPDSMRLEFDIKEYYDREELAAKLLGAEIKREKTIDAEEIISGSRKLIFNEYGFLYENNKPGDSYRISGRNEAEKYAAGFLRNLNLPVKEYYLDNYQVNRDGSVVLAFYERYRSYIIFDNRFEISLSSGGVSRAAVSYKKIKNLKTQNHKVLAAYTILVRNRSTFENSVITAVEPGFIQQDDGSGSPGVTEHLYWRVRAKDGREWFFAAQGYD